MPKWEKLFKAWGIYKADYHNKYRQYIHSKRYKTYIKLVTNDIQERVRSINKAQAEELLKDFFRKKEFVCPDLPKGE